jgi:hypothetical protein
MRLLDNKMLVYLTPQERDAVFTALGRRRLGYTTTKQRITSRGLVIYLYDPKGRCVGENAGDCHSSNRTFCLEPQVLSDCLEVPGAKEAFLLWETPAGKTETPKGHYLWLGD